MSSLGLPHLAFFPAMTMGACPSSGLATAAAARGSSLVSAAAAARRLTGVRGLSETSAVSPLLSLTGFPQKKQHAQLQRCRPAQRYGGQRLVTTAAAQTTSEALTSSAPTSALEEFFRSSVRPDFDILKQEVHGMPLVYLDSAATSQKPRQVIDAMDDYYRRYNANVHRGVHTLSSLATEEYERAREKVAAFVNAARREEIVFTRNASEAINLVAYAWGAANLEPGDEVVLTVAEHHSNLVPWQMIAQRTGAVLRHAGLKALEGGGEEVDVDQLLDLITPRTKMVSVHHISNTLGSSLPIERIVAHTRAVTDGNARVLVDACQSVPHMAVDVQALGVDFAVASSHKMLGPTGIGFLYGRYDLLSSMPPFLGGGEMIADVFLDYSTYAEPPSRFEAGTPAIAEAVGLGAAIDYLNEIGMDAVHNYEMELATYMYSKLREVPHVRIFGPPPPSLLKSNTGSSSSSLGRAAALCAFNVDCVHPTDLSTFLDQQHGIAIRSGHHCTQPLHRELGISSSARASLHVYNTRAEVDAFVAALHDTIDFFCSVLS